MRYKNIYQYVELEGELTSTRRQRLHSDTSYDVGGFESVEIGFCWSGRRKFLLLRTHQLTCALGSTACLHQSNPTIYCQMYGLPHIDSGIDLFVECFLRFDSLTQPLQAVEANRRFLLVDKFKQPCRLGKVFMLQTFVESLVVSRPKQLLQPAGDVLQVVVEVVGKVRHFRHYLSLIEWDARVKMSVFYDFLIIVSKKRGDEYGNK